LGVGGAVVEVGHGATASTVSGPVRRNVASKLVRSLFPPPREPRLTHASHTRHDVSVTCRHRNLVTPSYIVSRASSSTRACPGACSPPVVSRRPGGGRRSPPGTRI